MRIRITNLPEPGFGISVGEHRYTLRAYVDHMREDATETRLGVWSGNCAGCGESFEQMAPLHVVPETRRCERHRRPGRKA